MKALLFAIPLLVFGIICHSSEASTKTCRVSIDGEAAGSITKAVGSAVWVATWKDGSMVSANDYQCSGVFCQRLNAVSERMVMTESLLFDFEQSQLKQLTGTFRMDGYPAGFIETPNATASVRQSTFLLECSQ